MDLSKRLSDDIQQLKAAAKQNGRNVTSRDLWEFLVSGIAIRRHFKGKLFNFAGGESSQQTFDRKLKDLFGLTFEEVSTPLPLREKKQKTEQPEWLKNQTYGLEGGDDITVVIDGEKFAVIKSPGKKYRSGQETKYGAVRFSLLAKFPENTRRGTSAIHGVLLREAGRMTRLDNINWTRKVVESDRKGKLINF